METWSLPAYRAFHWYWLAPVRGSFQNALWGIGAVERAWPPMQRISAGRPNRLPSRSRVKARSRGNVSRDPLRPFADDQDATVGPHGAKVNDLALLVDMFQVDHRSLIAGFALWGKHERATTVADLKDPQTDAAGAILHSFKRQPAVDRREQANRPGIVAIGQVLRNSDLVRAILEGLLRVSIAMLEQPGRGPAGTGSADSGAPFLPK